MCTERDHWAYFHILLEDCVCELQVLLFVMCYAV